MSLQLVYKTQCFKLLSGGEIQELSLMTSIVGLWQCKVKITHLNHMLTSKGIFLYADYNDRLS
jgi:hypothetical protein